VTGATTASTAELTYTSTVPRTLVHKQAIEQVFLTDSAQGGEDEFLVAAQLPRTHLFFNEPNACASYDLMLLTELKRQGTVAVGHRYLEIPYGYRFVWRWLDIALDADAHIGDACSHFVLEQTVSDREYRDGALASWRADSVMFLDGERIGHANATAAVMPDPVYQRIRGKIRDRKSIADAKPLDPIPPTEPSKVGRINPRNVVIASPEETGDGRLCAEMVLDLSHPCFFDHELDHVPGMLLLETLRQTGLAAVGRQHGFEASELYMTACEADFIDFGELELQLTSSAKVGPVEQDGGRTSVEVELGLHQAGEEITKARGRVQHLGG
jgi:hypothetical protein